MEQMCRQKRKRNSFNLSHPLKQRKRSKLKGHAVEQNLYTSYISLKIFMIAYF